MHNVEWRIRVLKYQRTYLLHPVLGQFSWNIQDKYLLIMYAILFHLLSFCLFIFAFILFLHRNYCKIIALTLVIELILVIKLTFQCFFIHWTGEVFNIIHERTLIWWCDLRYLRFTNTILIICVLINYTKWLFVFNFVRTKIKSFPNGRFIWLIQELHCLELLDKIHSGIVYFLFSVATRRFYLLQKKWISPSVHIHCIPFTGRFIFLFVFIYSYVYARKLFMSDARCFR